ncbi:MAG TPA: hypothetical protein VHX99_08035 [Rhizomicrobium sp.]|jgi:hypothetical protein|nr:hypothetical protein [Rhizomicrobium sp.]
MFKQTAAAFIASLGFSAAAAAQTPQPPDTCTLPKIADTAALEQVPGTGLVTVPVTINGATKQFLLDLGMNKPTEVSQTAMADLRLPADPKRTELIRYGAKGLATPSYAGIQAPVYDVRDNTGVAALDTRVVHRGKRHRSQSAIHGGKEGRDRTLGTL